MRTNVAVIAIRSRSILNGQLPLNLDIGNPGVCQRMNFTVEKG
jgi:hypothetical protein